VAGLLIQAGNVLSPTLIQWGSTTGFGDATNPGAMSDVFVRVGGYNDPSQNEVSTTVQLTVNHNYFILDNTWLWRADHDITGPVYDSQNPNDHGVIVNGDSVVMYGLAVEHALKDAVIWNGEGARVYFYQNELPYDVTQENFGDPGYTGYTVSDHVQTHNVWGGPGVYSYFRDNTVYTPSAVIAPTGGGIQFVQAFTRFLNGFGGITHIVNEDGAPVNTTNPLAYLC